MMASSEFERVESGVSRMDCRQSQSFLALMVGQDHADSAAECLVRQHVVGCPSCRKFHAELLASQAALADSRIQVGARRQLWPRVAERLAELECRPQFARFNVWVPTAVAAAACLLLVAVAAVEMQRRDDSLFRSMAGNRPAVRD